MRWFLAIVVVILLCVAWFFAAPASAVCNCPAGQYHVLTETSCAECPPGFHCSSSDITACLAGSFNPVGGEDANGDCVACPAGQYAPNPQSDKCELCPAGSSCSASVATACDDGYYSLEGQTDCFECPPGHECPSKVNPPIPCEAGEYAPAGSESCSACTAGHKCPDPTGVEENCNAPAEYSSSGSAVTCTQCPAGNSCTATSTTACTAGEEYSLLGGGTCLDCPSGYTCPVASNPPVRCAPGQHTNGNSRQTSCTNCAAGSSCANPNNDAVVCAAGYYQPDPSRTSCLPCPAGSSCTTTTATPCADGEYSLLGQASCTQCVAGQACENKDEPPVHCAPGSHTGGLDGQESCTLCVAGQACPSPTAAPISCTLPLVSLSSGALRCVPCPAGVSCGSSSTSSPCNGDSYSLEGETACTVCPVGYSCPSTSAHPIACQPGTYSLVGETSCTTCSAGESCADPTQEPVDCVLPQYSPSQSAACLECPAGFSCSSPSSTPQPCATGSWSALGDQSCHACVAGTACPNEDEPPIFCEPGYHTNGLPSQTVCSNCPQGSQCSDPTVAPQTCPSGSYSNAPNAVTCTLCPAGSACPNADGTSITACAAGTYSPLGEAACTACPAGTYSTGGAGACTRCPDGSDCSDQTVVPSTCTSPGFYRLGTTGGCVQCPQGYRCPDPDDPPILCLLGEYSALGAGTCTECPQGSFCSSQFVSGPTDCPKGFISGDGAHQCTACPEGTVSNGARTACDNCQAGKQCPDPKLDPLDCPTGYYSSTGPNIACTVTLPGNFISSPSGTPDPCPAGETSGYAATACSPCPDGFDCSGGSPSLCEAGTYADGGECEDCPAGSACPQPYLDPIPCGSGYYSAAKATTCLRCPAGFQCSVSANPPQACGGTNRYSLPGHSSGTCPACPAGYECPSPSLRPRQCLPGSRSAANAASCTVCAAGQACPTTTAAIVTCAAGTYSLGSATVCTPCEAGYQCPSTTTISDRTRCPDGTYSGGSLDSCTQCPAGVSCIIDSSTTTGCPSGTYSAAGEMTCTVCPPGFECSTSGPPVACASGRYSPGGLESCLLCPAGFECPTPAASVAIPCKLGFVSGLGQAQCSACNAGNFCADPAVSSTAGNGCAQGSFALAGSVTCNPCPAGYSCPSNSNNLPGSKCAAGQYSTLGDASCNNCPAGYYCPDPAAYPIRCEPGFYSTGTAQYCTPCPAGRYCPFPYTQNLACPAGSWSGGSAVVCSSCMPGYSCAASATSPTPVADICPTGRYCPDGITITNCPAGFVGNGLTGGRSLHEACIQCPAGSFCTGQNNIASCPNGYYCPTGTTAGNRYPCPRGTFHDTTFPNPLVSVEECLPCPRGRYCGLATSGTPPACIAGHYCLAGTFTSNQYPCPAGTFSADTGNVSPADCDNVCTSGHYCPPGSSAPLACPAGTFNPLTGAGSIENCIPCPAGYACTTAGLSVGTGVACTAGYYCPLGSDSATKFPCPAGTFSPATDLTSAGDCSVCWEGHACPQASGGATPPLDCAAGHYCPGAPENAFDTDYNYENYFGDRATFPEEFPCPPGTFTAATDLTQASECSPCDPGHFCSGGGSAVSGDCAAGHYCPTNTTFATQYPCPAGTFSAATDLTDGSECSACPEGSFCPAGSTAPSPCPAGTYTNVTNTRYDYPSHTWGEGSCAVCPAGFRCPADTDDPVPCAAGTMSRNMESTCSTCPAGYYCPNSEVAYRTMISSLQCPAGLFCPDGVDVVPTIGTHACPSGHYCPQATREPIPCPAGTFNEDTGQSSLSDCQPCTAGSFCTEGRSTPNALCNPGHFCPQGSSGPEQEPCPPGTYLGTFGGSSASSCLNCTAGGYCQRGSVHPLVCPEGHYCTDNLDHPIPCPIGTYNNQTGRTVDTQCTACDPGYYCDTEGKNNVTGLCDPGYYCVSRAVSSAPRDGPTGGLCPRGGYCPQGSFFFTACPEGTVNNKTGGQTIDECEPCPAGFYCSGSAQTGASDLCDPGYFCNGSAITPTQFATPAGYYTPLGSSAPIACPAGQYAPNATMGSCLECPDGFVCPEQATVDPTPCLGGQYCAGGSFRVNRCDIGYYSPTIGATNSSTCLPCTPGYYCEAPGQAAVSGSCFAGYECSDRAVKPNPQSPSDLPNRPCPTGYFCPAATFAAQPCPAGTYNPRVSLQAESECQECPAGQYCSEASTLPDGDCQVGYFCLGNATVANPTDGVTGDICPAGSFCPTGSTHSRLCAEGTYQPNSGMGGCLPCPAGFFCAEGTVTPEDCPVGRFCPESTTPDIPKCPAGTYNNTENLQQESQCTLCPGGFSCTLPGLSAPNLVCPAGYFCTLGALDNAGGVLAPSGVGGICPIGHFCPPQTTTPHPCPAGTYSNELRLTSVEECQPCTPGHYCGSNGLTEPSGLCQEGYYCLGNSSMANPTDGVMGDSCPTGHYCPAGSRIPTPCAAGTFQDSTGEASCKTCTEGYYCPSQTSLATDFPCPVGFVCPAGTRYARQFPCPRGTYNPVETRFLEVDHCLPCEPGHYCPYTGMNDTGFNCTAGFYCTGRASLAAPMDGVTGNRCTRGHYCPAGSSQLTSCDPGYFCKSVGLGAPTGQCAAGYYCTGGALSSRPTDGVTGNICPTGHYCHVGTVDPAPCPVSTFGPNLGNVELSQCLNCTLGSYCASQNLTLPTGLCSAGFYCPPSQTTPNPSTFQCPLGHFCPMGTRDPKTCPVATYQDTLAQSTCKACEPGYHCNDVSPGDPATTTQRRNCPPGFFCLADTTFPNQYPCPIGTYNNETNVETEADCRSCEPGYYCDRRGLAAPVDECDAGFFCSGGATTRNPVSAQEGGGECPQGFYCPKGTKSPIPCPAGFFSNATRNTELEECGPCNPGVWCDGAGGQFPCDPGYVCLNQSSTPTPSAAPQGFPCPPGTYCPQQSGAVLECLPGTWNPLSTQGECVPCPGGQYCNVSGTFQVLPCPAGYYCPQGTVNPLPCPPGRFRSTTGAVLETDCSLCSPGKYCPDRGMSFGGYDCDAGFACVSGADNQAPVTTSFPSNGPCPVGHFCVAGTSVPQPCPSGTYMPTTQAASESQCISCTPGRYCAGGLSAVSGLCGAGYYCPGGQSVVNPSGLECPLGHRCPSGTVLPIGCEDGSYQDTIAQGVCKSCPAGSYCNTNATAPVTCPEGSYCVQSSSFPTRCPSGTYGAAPGLTSVSACSVCPPGMFCTDGLVSGSCAAGFYCSTGQNRPDPPAINVLGGPCQPGYFCPNASATQTGCPEGRIRTDTHGTQSADCGPCPSGYLCLPGEASPVPCPAGGYCPPFDGFTPCPNGTYSTLRFQTNITTCKPCPSKYYCPVEGVSQFTQYPCTRGHYCELGTISPIDCPPGRFRSTTLGGSASDCATCTGGYTCQSATVTPDPCPAGTYCPPGSVVPLTCPPSYYCPEATEDPLLCPAGFYCTEGLGSPIPCTRGHFCVNGTRFPELCPLGTFTPDSIVNLTTVDVACQDCEAGSAGIDPARLNCTTCEAGYVCRAGATTLTPVNNQTENGYQCPRGFYCPAGTISPFPCPAGTYGGAFGLVQESQCTPCTPNTFNPRVGQPGCFPCGTSAISTNGSTTCECLGANRAYQAFDGSCVCQPGYQFIEDGVSLSDEDSKTDCEPIVYDRCSGARNTTGSCNTDCSLFCPSGVGTLSITSGVCDCQGIPNENEICDQQCREEQLQLMVDPRTRKVFVVRSNTLDSQNGTTDLSGAVASFDLSSITSGLLDCQSDGSGGTLGTCSMQIVWSSNQGAKGVMNPSIEFITSMLNSNRSSAEITEFSGGGTTRSLLQSSQTTEPTGVTSPQLCLQKGEMVVWDISDPSREHFPVYLKESLLNSNNLFDFGAFRQLRDLMASNIEMRTFGFTFNDPGTYVFADNAVRSRITVVTVLDTNEQCPSSSSVRTISTNNLVTVGTTARNDILLSPDWLLISILLVGMVLLLSGTVAAMYYFRKNRWGKQTADDAPYKKHALSLDFMRFSSKGSAVKKKWLHDHADILVEKPMVDGQGQVDASNDLGKLHRIGVISQKEDDNFEMVLSDKVAEGDLFWDFERQVELESFDVHTLYGVIDGQTSSLTDRMDESANRLLCLYRKIAIHTQMIRNLLSNKATDVADLLEEDLPEDKTAMDVKRALDEEISLRDTYDSDRLQTMQRLEQALEDLVKQTPFSTEAATKESMLELDVRFHAVVEEIRLLCEQAEQERQRFREIRDSFRQNVGDKLMEIVIDNTHNEKKAEDVVLQHYTRLGDLLETSFSGVPQRAKGGASEQDRADAEMQIKQWGRQLLVSVEGSRCPESAVENLAAEGVHSTENRRAAKKMLAALMKKSEVEMLLTEDNLQKLLKELRRCLEEMEEDEESVISSEGDFDDMDIVLEADEDEAGKILELVEEEDLKDPAREEEDAEDDRNREALDRELSEMHAQRKADELAEEERKALEDARLKGLSDEEIDAIQKRYEEERQAELDRLRRRQEEMRRRMEEQMARRRRKHKQEMKSKEENALQQEGRELAAEEQEVVAEIDTLEAEEMKRARDRGASEEELDDIRNRFEAERLEAEERMRRKKEDMWRKHQERLARRKRKDNKRTEGGAAPKAETLRELEEEFEIRSQQEQELLQEEKEAALERARANGASQRELDDIEARYSRECEEMEARLRRQREEMEAKLKARLQKRIQKDKFDQDDVDNVLAMEEAKEAARIEDAKQRALQQAAADGATPEELDRIAAQFDKEARDLQERLRLKREEMEAKMRARRRKGGQRPGSRGTGRGEFPSDIADDEEDLEALERMEKNVEQCKALSEEAKDYSRDITKMLDSFAGDKAALKDMIEQQRRRQERDFERRRRRREKEHRNEQDLLEKSLQEEAAKDVADLENDFRDRMVSIYDQMSEDKEAALKAARDRGASEQEMDSIKKHFELEADLAIERIERQREEMRAKLERRLAKQHRKQVNQLKESQAEEMKEMTEDFKASVKDIKDIMSGFEGNDQVMRDRLEMQKRDHQRRLQQQLFSRKQRQEKARQAEQASSEALAETERMEALAEEERVIKQIEVDAMQLLKKQREEEMRAATDESERKKIQAKFEEEQIKVKDRLERQKEKMLEKTRLAVSHKKKIRESEMKKRYEKQNQDLRQEIEELEDMSLQAADSGGGSGAADVSDRLRQEMLAREEEERAVERVRMEMLQEEYSLQEMRNQQAEEAAALEAKAAILEDYEAERLRLEEKHRLEIERQKEKVFAAQAKARQEKEKIRRARAEAKRQAEEEARRKLQEEEDRLEEERARREEEAERKRMEEQAAEAERLEREQLEQLEREKQERLAKENTEEAKKLILDSYQEQSLALREMQEKRKQEKLEQSRQALEKKKALRDAERRAKAEQRKLEEEERRRAEEERMREEAMVEELEEAKTSEAKQMIIDQYQQTKEQERQRHEEARRRQQAKVEKQKLEIRKKREKERKNREGKLKLDKELEEKRRRQEEENEKRRQEEERHRLEMEIRQRQMAEEEERRLEEERRREEERLASETENRKKTILLAAEEELKKREMMIEDQKRKQLEKLEAQKAKQKQNRARAQEDAAAREERERQELEEKARREKMQEEELARERARLQEEQRKRQEEEELQAQREMERLAEKQVKIEAQMENEKESIIRKAAEDREALERKLQQQKKAQMEKLQRDKAAMRRKRLLEQKKQMIQEEEERERKAREEQRERERQEEEELQRLAVERGAAKNEVTEELMHQRHAREMEELYERQQERHQGRVEAVLEEISAEEEEKLNDINDDFFAREQNLDADDEEMRRLEEEKQAALETYQLKHRMRMENAPSEAESRVKQQEKQEMLDLQREHLIELGGKPPEKRVDHARIAQQLAMDEQNTAMIAKLKAQLEAERKERERASQQTPDTGRRRPGSAASSSRSPVPPEAPDEDEDEDEAGEDDMAQKIVDDHVMKERRREQQLEAKKQQAELQVKKRLEKIHAQRLKKQKEEEEKKAAFMRTASGKLTSAANAMKAAKKWKTAAATAEGGSDEASQGEGAGLEVASDVELSQGKGRRQRVPIDEKVLGRILNAGPWRQIIERMEEKLVEATRKMPAAPPVAPRSSEESRKRKLRELEERKRVLDEKSRRVNELAALAEEMSAESTTASGGQGSAAGGPAASPSPTDAVAELFADRLEKTLERGQRLVNVDPEEQGISFLVVYQFGRSLLGKLWGMLPQHSGDSSSAPQLLVASELPPLEESCLGSAFSKSVHWVASANCLHVHEARLGTVADLCLCLVHSVAHIAAGKMGEDSNPAFVREFYALLKRVSDEYHHLVASAPSAEEEDMAAMDSLGAPTLSVSPVSGEPSSRAHQRFRSSMPGSSVSTSGDIQDVVLRMMALNTQDVTVDESKFDEFMRKSGFNVSSS